MSLLDVFVPISDPADLDRRLFSLTLQDYAPIAVHVLCPKHLMPRAKALLSLNPHASIATGAPLGDYLAVLPPNGTIAPSGYTALIGELVRSGAAVAVGSIAEKLATPLPHATYTTQLRLPRERPSREGLTRLGRYPIHAAVFDRAQIDAAALRPGRGSDRLLPRLCRRYAASFALAATIVGDLTVTSRLGSRTW